MLIIERVLDPAEAAAFLDAARALAFEDGGKTAGRHARAVKHNEQAASGEERDRLLAAIMERVSANPVFRSAARPAHLTRPLLSRYRPGMDYGTHVDDAIMGGLRTDLSWTLFLAPPETYEGGALSIEDMVEARSFRLAAGDMILYPTTALHRVEPVSSGERIAVVGWVQSLVRDQARRDILFDLDRAVETVNAQEGRTPLFERLALTRSNLIRMWAEP